MTPPTTLIHDVDPLPQSKVKVGGSRLGNQGRGSRSWGQGLGRGQGLGSRLWSRFGVKVVVKVWCQGHAVKVRGHDRWSKGRGQGQGVKVRGGGQGQGSSLWDLGQMVGGV